MKINLLKKKSDNTMSLLKGREKIRILELTDNLCQICACATCTIYVGTRFVKYWGVLAQVWHELLFSRLDLCAKGWHGFGTGCVLASKSIKLSNLFVMGQDLIA